MAIKHTEFDLSKVSFGDPEEDRMKNISVPIKYERNGKPGPITFNLPIVRTGDDGVTSMKNERTGDESHSIKIFFPRKKPILVEDKDEEGNIIGGHYEEPDTIPNPEVEDEMMDNAYDEAQAYVDITDQIYQKAVDHCFANKAKLGFGNAKQRLMVEAQLKAPIYRRTVSEEDDSEDLNYPPSIYLKFIESGANAKQSPNTVYTTFTGVDQKPIHWKSLINTRMYLLPTMRIERIFLGAKKNIQCKVTRAIVLETRAREEMSQDTKIVQELLASNPSLLQAFLKSIGGLEKYREVKRESDFSTKNKEKEKFTEIKAQPMPGAPAVNEDPEEDDAREVQKPASPIETESVLDNFMQKQGGAATPTVKKVIARKPVTAKA